MVKAKESYLRTEKRKYIPYRIKEQVERIINGWSPIKRTIYHGDLLQVGDKVEIISRGWVEVVNIHPIPQHFQNKEGYAMLREGRSLKHCVVEEGGVIEILGFTEDGLKALVQYTSPPHSCPIGTTAPSGIQYFISLEHFSLLKRIQTSGVA